MFLCREKPTTLKGEAYAVCNLFWRDREATPSRNRGGVLGGWSQRPARCRGSVLRRVQYQRGVAQALRSSFPTTKLRGCMKIPNEITKAWVRKHGLEIGVVHIEGKGYKSCLLKKRGPKLVHFTQLYPKRNFTLTHREAERQFTPCVRRKGKWKYA
jgi:hypothetical protein